MRRMTASRNCLAIRRAARTTLAAAALVGVLVGASAGALAASPVAAADRPEPDASQAFVEKLADDAIRTWGMHTSDVAARHEAMAALIHSTFDVDYITRAVLGRHWRKLDPDERRQFRELFQKFVIEIYLPHLAKHSRDRLRVVGARARGKRDVIVRSEIRTRRGDWIEADWRLRSAPDGIRIIDISVAGVSLLLVQRQEFEAVIRRSGFASLVEQLRERISKAEELRG